MGVIVEELESTCSIPPTRLFKAYLLDLHNILPKVLPSVFKSIELTKGNGEPGSIMVITCYHGDKVSSLERKVEEIDETNHVYRYSAILTDVMGEEFESALTEVKIEAGPNGGSIYKAITTYHIKGENHNSIREKIDKSKEANKAFLQAVEAYLQANPSEYK